MSEKKLLRLCVVILSVALALQMTADRWMPAVQQLKLGQVLLFLQTGRLVRYTPAAEQREAGVEIAGISQDKPVFSEADEALIPLRNDSGKDPDVATALLEPLQWDLYNDQPAVLILHSHGSESYTKTEDYTESAAYRTLDTNYNMVSIGDLVAQELEKAGIRVIHDRTLYDTPSYNDAYVQARAGIQAHLADNPSIQLVLDLHRDAATDANGNQVRYVVSTAEGDAAKLMLVLGANHEGWNSNLALAAKLQVQLEKICPGICRTINLRAQRFNQDLCPNTLLVEVGSTGNTRAEALQAAKHLAQAVISLASGSG